jgi:hypothetical protein
MMVTKPRVTRCRQYSQLNRPKGVKQDTSITWHNTNVTVGQDGMITCHSHLNGGVWSDQSYQNKRNQRGAQTLERGLSKSIQSHKDYLISGLGLPRLFTKSLRVTQMFPAIDLEQ